MNNDSHLFKIAREVSKKADYTGCCDVKIGCVITYKGAILAKGYNTDKTHTKQEYYNKWRYKDCGNKYLPSKSHAELMALSKIQYLDIDFSKVHIYTYREFKNGKRAMSRCCPSCLAAIKAMNIRHIHYTTPDGEVHEILK